MKRTFIYADDKSNKFWTIDINGAEFTVTYGKVIGSISQTSTKSFADEAACQKEANKLIAGKLKKGYVEQNVTKPAVVPTNLSELSDMPTRPATVPATARWKAEEKIWMDFDKTKNPNGLGDVRKWTIDGVLTEFTSYKKDKGYILIYYHPDGSLAQQTEYKGVMAIRHGTFIDQRSDTPNPAIKFSINIPEVWKIVRTFKDGERKTIDFYNKAGSLLNREKILDAIQPKAATVVPPKPANNEIDPNDLKPWPKNVAIKKIPFNDALALMPSCKPKYGKGDNLYALLIQGDVHLKNDLVLDECYLGQYTAILVQGNLTIDGLLQHASGESSEPVLVVTGNLTVDTLIYGETDIIVGGNFTAKSPVLGFWEGSLLIAGKLSIPAIYAPDQYIEVGGKKLAGKYTLGKDDFLPEYRDEDGAIDLIGVREAIFKHKSVFP